MMVPGGVGGEGACFGGKVSVSVGAHGEGRTNGDAAAAAGDVAGVVEGAGGGHAVGGAAGAGVPDAGAVVADGMVLSVVLVTVLMRNLLVLPERG